MNRYIVFQAMIEEKDLKRKRKMKTFNTLVAMQPAPERRIDLGEAFMERCETVSPDKVRPRCLAGWKNQRLGMDFTGAQRP